ncbi:MAG TPA: two-component system response regulator KdpE [Candidatus Competibacteraceae bacterium]|nr:two-component system response regulator KdpE [Candidatus Competibacteraceae bacterium]
MSSTIPTILVVEDEKEIRRFVRLALETDGCQVVEAEGYQRGLIEAGTRQPDLLMLDLGLPDGDGIALIRELRGWSSLPILVLSARSQEADKIQALNTGADDYLTKPFGVGELLARVRAILRRRSHTGDPGQTLVNFGTVRVDLIRRVVEKAGQPVHLTPLEYRLLALLLQHAGTVLTHRQLLREVWGPSYLESAHYLRVYMGHLRQKLEADPTRPRYLLTETGVGYRFVG